MKKWKILGIVLSALVMVVCLGVDVWYYYVWKFAPDKIVSNTYEVGMQTTTNDDSKYFIEINYYSNKNKNGLETFEIKYNYMLDENQENFFSQGLQYVANSVNDSINFEYRKDASQTSGLYMDSTPGWYTGGDNYAWFGSYRVNDNATMYNYASGDDYKTPIISTNPISLNTRFKIQLGNDLFLMSFKNKDTKISANNFEYQEPGAYHFYLVYGRKDYNWYYSYYDYHYFSKLMYQAVQSVTPGIDRAVVFEFGDLFDYYQYDGASYSDTKLKNADSVIQEMKSYYSIKINVSENGMQKSSESIFNMLHGSTTYNLTNDYSSDDYFIGRTIINCNIYDFNYVLVVDNKYEIKLKNQFVEFYQNYSLIYLSIELDLDKLKQENITYVGLTKDNNLNMFNILEFYTLETINGQVVRTEVQYANVII